ncbi:MAG: DNA starvation/stationary phase protection protein [Brevefilum sp.]|nr:DNA starvation/stationary phase protection protein [Brevefilum sp.]MDW7755775.1 DNA starvation/stationary phase protection protein [Brevefilum sp.]
MQDANNDGNDPKTQIFVKPKKGSDNNKEQILIYQPNIGLASDVRVPVVDMLNISLANESVLSQKTRSAHWNGSGPGFLELHIFFETQYKQLNEIIDKIAERTRMLGGIALGSFQEFLDHTQIKIRPDNIPDVLHLLADHETIIRNLREDIRKCSEDYEDDATVDLLVGVMSLHEKMAWMLRSYIVPRPIKA